LSVISFQFKEREASIDASGDSCLVEDFVQDLCCPAQRQVADVEVARAEIEQRPYRSCADVDWRRTRGKLLAQLTDRHGQKLLQRLQRCLVRAAIVEDAKNRRYRQTSSLRFREESFDLLRLVV